MASSCTSCLEILSWMPSSVPVTALMGCHLPCGPKDAPPGEVRGYAVTARVNDETLYAPECRRLWRGPAHHGARPPRLRESVVGHGLRGVPRCKAQSTPRGHATVMPLPSRSTAGEHLFGVVVRMDPCSGEETHLLGIVELVELRHGAAGVRISPVLASTRSREQVGRVLAGAWVDHKVGDRLGDGIDYYAAYLTADPSLHLASTPSRERVVSTSHPLISRIFRIVGDRWRGGRLRPGSTSELTEGGRGPNRDGGRCSAKRSRRGKRDATDRQHRCQTASPERGEGQSEGLLGGSTSAYRRRYA